MKILLLGWEVVDKYSSAEAIDRMKKRPTVGFFDDLPWVVFEGLESPLSTGGEEGLAEGLDGDALTRCCVR